MKIDLYNNVNLFLPHVNKSSGNQGGSTNFSRLLKSTLNQSGNEQGVDHGMTQSVSYSKVSTVFPLKAGNADPIVLVNHIEDLLDKLDEYRLKLDDQKTIPEQVGPIVNALIAAKERLVLRAYHLTENNTLKEIAGQAIEITDREINNYKKGHYLPVLAECP